MRVLFPFVGDTIGGSHVSALELIKALPQQQVDPIIALHQDGPLAAYLRDNGFDFLEAHALPFFSPKRRLWKQRWLMWRTSRAYADFLARHRIDCVHTNDSRMHVSWVGAARTAGVKHVWHQRNTWDFKNQNPIAEMSSQIVTISEHCRASFPAALQSHVVQVWDPVTLEGMADRGADLRSEYGLPPNTKLIAYIANFMARKRPEACVQIAAEFAARDLKDIAILMIGDPREPFLTRINDMIREQRLERACIVTGPRFPIGPLLKQCDALLAPAVNEGFGRTLVEAMLCGVPVVAAKDGGHIEILEDGTTGFLVEVDDISAYADKLTCVLQSDADVRSMITKAQEVANTRFSAEAHARRLVEIYEKGT